VLLVVAGWPLLRTIFLSFTDARLSAAQEVTFVGVDNYLFYGPTQNDFDPELGGYYITDPATGEDLVYVPETDEFYLIDWDNYRPAAEPFPGEVDRDAVFRWQGVLADPLWWNSVWNTVKFSFISVVIEVILGMIIALILNANFRGRGLLRAAVLIPWAIPTIVSAQMWGWMFNDQYGVINEIFRGLGFLARGETLAWTADSDLVLPAIILVDVWKTTPFMTLLILAALQLLPGEIYEAARVDGIHPVRVFFKITVPLIRPALMVAVIFRALDALRIFDLIYVLTSNSRETASMSVYARQQLMDFQNVGFGSAASTALFLMIAVFTLLYMWLGRVRFSA
jgi:trehalose/maltose transport system permease protein